MALFVDSDVFVDSFVVLCLDLLVDLVTRICSWMCFQPPVFDNYFKSVSFARLVQVRAKQSQKLK